MAISIASSPRNFLPTSEDPLFLGVRKIWIGQVQGDSSYPTGGYSFDPYLVGLNQLGHILFPPMMVPGTATPTYWIWNPATKTVQVVNPTGTEIVNGTDLSASVALALVVGL